MIIQSVLKYVMWVSISLKTNEISLSFKVKVTLFSSYSAKYQATNNHRPHVDGDMMLCYARLHYTTLHYFTLSEKCKDGLLSSIYMKICVKEMYLEEVEILQKPSFT